MMDYTVWLFSHTQLWQALHARGQRASRCLEGEDTKAGPLPAHREYALVYDRAGGPTRRMLNPGDIVAALEEKYPDLPVVHVSNLIRVGAPHTSTSPPPRPPAPERHPAYPVVPHGRPCAGRGAAFRGLCPHAHMPTCHRVQRIGAHVLTTLVTCVDMCPNGVASCRTFRSASRPSCSRGPEWRSSRTADTSRTSCTCRTAGRPSRSFAARRASTAGSRPTTTPISCGSTGA